MLNMCFLYYDGFLTSTVRTALFSLNVHFRNESELLMFSTTGIPFPRSASMFDL